MFIVHTTDVTVIFYYPNEIYREYAIWILISSDIQLKWTDFLNLNLLAQKKLLENLFHIHTFYFKSRKTN